MPDTKSAPSKSGVNPKLLEILVCPVTKDTLVYKQDSDKLISRGAQLAYPIRDGIPIMLPEEARALSDEEIRTLT